MVRLLWWKFELAWANAFDLQGSFSRRENVGHDRGSKEGPQQRSSADQVREVFGVQDVFHDWSQLYQTG